MSVGEKLSRFIDIDTKKQSRKEGKFAKIGSL